MRATAILAGLVAAGLLGGSARADTLEYAVKAAYLTKFTPFIDWPDAAFAGQNAALNICILGDDPFGGALDSAAAGQKVGGHALAIRRIATPDPACQILFINAADPQAADAAIAAVKDKPVVTVTDSGLRTHGVISFVMIDNHVRFDIDDAAAQACGLQISSKLLDLAHNVKRKGAAQ